MRLFLAIDPPQDVKFSIEKQIVSLKKEYPQFEWIPIENYHLTLHFFGEVVDSKKVFSQLEELLFDQESFYLYFLNTGMFLQHRITMYLNFRREKRLEKIVKKVKEKFYLPEQRIEKYVPHLTFARYRIPSKQQYFVMKKRLSKLNLDISFAVKKLILFESILGGKNHIYKKIQSIKLL